MSSYENSAEYGSQIPVIGSDLFGAMAGLSLQTSPEWVYPTPPGQPHTLIGPIGAQRGLYHTLADTDGGLTEEARVNPVERVDNLKLEKLMADSIGHAINGWQAGLWYNFQIMGRLRESPLVAGHFYSPLHLAYAFSRDLSTYSVKKAFIRDEHESIAYPYALSNLISMTIRQHGLNTHTPLKHFIFYDVVNASAGTAMHRAFDAMGVSLPVLPERSMYEDEEIATHSRASRHQSSRGGKSKSKKVNTSACVTFNSEQRTAWGWLHTENPFTRALAHVGEEIRDLPRVVSYTLIAVAQDHFAGQEQTYWFAIIAHLDWFAPLAFGKGKGKEVQYNMAGQSSSGAWTHAQR